MLKTVTIPESLDFLLPNPGSLCSTAPLRQTGHMKSKLPILALVLLIACSTAQGHLVSKISDDRREFEIIKVEYSPRQATARISFSSSFGIFVFDLNPDGRKLKRLTFIVNNQRHCEGLSFQDRTGHTADLLRLQGVQVFRQGTDLVIEVTPPAVNLLQDGGRVQYVNQYR
jgi:hypothetical protein